MSNPSSICVECLKERNVWRTEIVQADAACILCGRETQSSIDLNEHSTRQLFRGLVRYHYGIEDHDSWLLEVEHPIIHVPKSDPNEDHDGLLELLHKLWFEDRDHDMIDLNGSNHWFSVKTEPNLNLVSIRRRLEKENYFSVEPALREKLEAVREYISTTAKDLTVFRARVGCPPPIESFPPKLPPDRIPFSGDQLGAPPPLLVKESGRVNRAGVSFFYVASDFDTTIAEVRPHPGDCVSVGKFKQTHECCIADFSRLDISEFCRSSQTYETFRFLHAINKELSTPVTPHERATGYLLGQLVGDVVRSMGFSGIRYSSSVGKGVNYCFFEQSQFRFVDGSQRLEQVLRLDYKHETMPSLHRTSNDDETSEIPF